MGLTIADSYYLKARGATQGFYCDWEEACESLNYALSYDENHVTSLCFLGEVYAKHLSMPQRAFDCFDKIIAVDPEYAEVYPKYAKSLIDANELERAEKLISFALTVITVDTAEMYRCNVLIEEIRGNYQECLVILKKLKGHIYNDYYFSFIEDEEKRIKKKMKLEKPKKKKKTRKKKSKNKKK